MRCLTLQIRTDAIADFDKEDFLRRLKAIKRAPEIDSFSEKGTRHLHFNFFTEMPEILWRDIKLNLYNESEYGKYLRTISLVACEGEKAGEEYLLHHYDAAEKLDFF